MSDTTPNHPPDVTIAIPMYRSARFIEQLIATVESIRDPGVEFLFSDQHLFDDAADQIRDHFRSDSRVRVVTSGDAVGWSENYNLLLKSANGRYLRWLAHDDSLPPEGLTRQVEIMDANPDAIGLAVNIQRVDLENHPLSLIDQSRIRPVQADEPWTLRHAIEIFANRRYGGAVKSLWRRLALVENDLWIRPTLDLNQPERVWLFGVALHGRMLHDPQYVYRKRVYPESTSARWKTDIRHDISYLRVGLGYLRDSQGWFTATLLSPVLAAIALLYRPMVRVRRRQLR